MAALRLAALFATLAFLCLAGERAATAGSDTPGDVNCDNQLTVVDPLELLKADAGLPANDDCAAVNADFTCDDAAGAADVPQLLAMIAGLDPEPCTPPSGEDAHGLIDEALANGDITRDEAVLYKLYYVFGDDRLPNDFDIPKDEDSDATGTLKQVGAEYASLSPAMQQQVGPYLVPPYYEGSWWDLQQEGASAAPQGQPNCRPNMGPTGCSTHPDWSSVSGSLVKVWYPNTFANGNVHAQATVQQIETQFWPALADVMQRTPPSDAGETNNGGDGLFDIAILPDTEDNFVEPYTPDDCAAEPAFMVITGNTAQAIGDNTMIHELMHAFQFAFDVQGDRACSEWDWVSEGTAHWAVRHLRPTVEYGNIQGRRYLEQTEFSMEGSIGGREYGSWIFWYFLTATNSPDLMFNIWLASEFHEDSLSGVDSAIPDGWEEQLPKFAQYALNRPPDDHFNQWLGIDHQLTGAPSIDVEVGPAGEMRYDLADAPKLEHLGAVYYHLTVDPGVRALGIYNGLRYEQVDTPSDSGTFIAPAIDGSYDPVPGLHIWLLQKVDGQWQDPIDWTNDFHRHYCREIPSERVEEVVLIASNSEFEDTNYRIEPVGLPVTVYASDFGCGAWRGTMQMELTTEDGFHEVVTGTDLVFERDPLQIGPWGVSYNVNYVLTSGSVEWEVDGSIGDCTVSGSGSGLTPEPGRHTLGTGNFFLDGIYHRAASGIVNIPDEQFYTVSCPGDPPEQVGHYVSVDFPVTGSLDPADAGGATLSGSTTINGIEYTWHLESGEP